MSYSADETLRLVEKDLMPTWQRERKRLDKIDQWLRWEHERPHAPRQATQEYRQLAERAPEPWGALIVTSVAQTLYVEGYRRADEPSNSGAWRRWQANGMDARQIPVHRATLGYGLSYGSTMPGETLAGEPMAQMRGYSPREMVAMYDDPAQDEWPIVAMRVRIVNADKVLVSVFDDEFRHDLIMGGLGSKPKHLSTIEHPAGVCPIVRFANQLDLEGRSCGEIEPFIPLLGSIDQTKFDRLVVQRFASWVVRTIAGMSVNETTATTKETAEQVKMRLKVEDMLIAADPDTRFGTLDATPLAGFIEAHDADVKTLGATSQTPFHEMLGMQNMAAEAIVEAKAGRSAKSDERRYSFGESWEQWMRLAAHVDGDEDGASDFEAEVRWKNTELRSLSQAADALGKLAEMLKIPVEVLWEKVPGMTEQDLQRAKILLDSDPLAKLFAGLDAQQDPVPAPA